MNKKIKLSVALGALTTSSIAVTAIALPQFNSIENYLFRDANWEESFLSRQDAFDHINNLTGKELFTQSANGELVISEYIVTAALSGAVDSYLSSMPTSSDSIFDNEVDAESEFNSQKITIEERIVSQIIAELANVGADPKYLPIDALVPGKAFEYDGTDATTSLTNWYMGYDNTGYTSLEQALLTLLETSYQPQYIYEGVYYTNLNDVYNLWYAENKFGDDSSYISYDEVTGQSAKLQYINSLGQIMNYNYSENSFDEENFIKKAEEEIAGNIEWDEFLTATRIDPTEEKWESTADFLNNYESYRTDPQNQVRVDSYLNPDLLDLSMGDALGWANSNQTSINGESNNFMSVRNNNFSPIYPKEGQNLVNGLPNLNTKLSSYEDIARLATAALFTTEYYASPVSSADPAQYLRDNINKMCQGGVSQRHTEEWKSWENFNKFMGFDKFTIPVEDREMAVPGQTVNKWWELDCEGFYPFFSSSPDADVINLFNWSYLSYFNKDMDLSTDALDNFWSAFSNGDSSNGGPLFIDSHFGEFTFSSKSGDPQLTGKTMMEALMFEVKSTPSMDDYRNSDTAYARDYTDWYSIQNYAYDWNGQLIEGLGKIGAKEELDKVIKAYALKFMQDIIYSEQVTSWYKFTDEVAEYTRSIDPTFMIDKFQAKEQAQSMTSGLFYGKGWGVIFTEDNDGTYTFYDDNGYGFDSSVVYGSKEAAAEAVSWHNGGAEVKNGSSFIDGTNYDTIIEYNDTETNLYRDFNNSGIDLWIDMSFDEMANEIVYGGGLDFEYVDPSIQTIYLDINEFDTNDTVSKTTYVSYSYRLWFDSLNSSESIWFDTEFVDPNDIKANLEAQDAAKQMLIDYWGKKLLG